MIGSERALYWLMMAEIIIQIHSWEDEEALTEITDALACAPALAVSVVFDHPAALDAVRRMDDRTDGHVMLGMSKIESAEEVRLAAEVGAKFALAPKLQESARREAEHLDMLYLPAVFTQAEVNAAYNAGVRSFFLFPAEIFGPQHLRELKRTHPDALFFPGVNIDEDEVGEYAASGAAAIVLELPMLGSPTWRQADIIAWVRTMTQRWRQGLLTAK